jgi:hypothetical protein
MPCQIMSVITGSVEDFVYTKLQFNLQSCMCVNPGISHEQKNELGVSENI